MLIADAHCDSMLDVIRGKRSLGERSLTGHIDIPRLIEANVCVQFFALFIESVYKPTGSLRRALQQIAAFYGEMKNNEKNVKVITTNNELEKHLQDRKAAVGAILAIEGGEALEGDLGVLECLFRLGVRSLGLTWNQRNALADGVNERHSRGGLTLLGKETVKMMNKLGMIVDLAHIAPAGFWDTLEVSSKPILVSHANCKKIFDHQRNLSDEQIKALAATQGVMGITFAPEFLAHEATIEDVVEHIDHVCQTVGNCLHVCYGSDFDGTESMPIGLEDVTKVPDLIISLNKRGYKEEDIKKIMGENLVQLLKVNLP